MSFAVIGVIVPIFTFAFLYSSLPTTQGRSVGLVGLEVDVEIERHRSHGTIAFSTGVSSVRLNSCFDVNIDSGSMRTSTALPRQCRERIGRRDRWINKAGYTAISCGRVGRGENARFPTF